MIRVIGDRGLGYIPALKETSPPGKRKVLGDQGQRATAEQPGDEPPTAEAAGQKDEVGHQVPEEGYAAVIPSAQSLLKQQRLKDTPIKAVMVLEQCVGGAQ